MFTTLRNNPKKSIFFGFAVTYGGYYCDNKLKEYQYRRRLCAAAKEGGDELIAPTQEPTRVTVVYNPVANNRKSSTFFKKNVYPLLNLNGYKVTLAETERQEEGKELMSVLKPDDQDCVCVAGGDGTLMEVITGLLRREDLRTKMKAIPLVLLPLGYMNSFARRNHLVKEDDTIGTLDEAVKLIKKAHLKSQNVIQLKMECSESTAEGVVQEMKTKSKEIYAVSGLTWSIDRDVTKVARTKWVFGPLRYHWQYFLSAMLGKHKKCNKSATLQYLETCDGCSKCVSTNMSQTQSPHGFKSSLASFFFPMFYRKRVSKDKEYQIQNEEKSKVTNDRCGVIHEKHIGDVRGLSVILDKDQLKVKVDKMEQHFVDFVQSGVARLLDIPYQDGDHQSPDDFNCSELQIVPDKVQGEHYYVDNEQLDAVPLRLRVLKEAVYFYL